jgi:predicted RND superfamily exporter protein
MIRRLTTALLRHRAISIALLLVSVVLSALGASKIQVRFSFRDFYAYDGNPDYSRFDRYTHDFGDPGGHVVLLLQSRDIFRTPYLEYIADISQDLSPNSLFSHIRSLSTVRIPRATGDGVETGPLMDHVPATADELEQLKRTALRSRLVLRRLVSEDGSATAVLAEMKVPTAVATVEQERAAIDAVRATLARRPPPPGLTATVTGGPSVEVGATGALVRDQMVLTPAVLGVIVLALVLTFRSVHGVLLALGTLSVCVLWTAGIFGAMGRSVDILGSTIPTILLVYGVVDPIFVLTRYFQKVYVSPSRDAAIIDTLEDMAFPCFLTSLTTALGFAAFASASMPSVRHVGIVVAIGVALSFVTTLTVLPLLLSLIAPPVRPLASFGIPRALDRGLRESWHFVNSNRAAVPLVAAGLLALGVVAGRGLRVNNVYVDSVPAGPERSAVRVLEEKLSGVARYVVFLEGPPGSMRRPEVLDAIARVDAAVEADPLVDSSISLPDLLQETHEAFSAGDPEATPVLASPQLIAQYLAILDPDDRSDFADESYSRTHIRILGKDRGGVEAARFRSVLDRLVKQEHFERFGIEASLTGNGVVTSREMDRMVGEILFGFLVAFAIAVGVEAIVFRSLRIAVVSVVPNLLPVVACFCVMRLFHIDFRTDSSLVLSVSIGGLFNTTIHIVVRIRKEIEAGYARPDVIIERALCAVGPASLYTAVILSAGFSMMLLSSFPGLQALGFLSMVTMLSAFFSDAIFTTTLMRLIYDWPREARRDVVAIGHAQSM